MKKNSKVMNVLMSLFLVMGMVFGNSVVMATGEPSDDSYSLSWDGPENDLVIVIPKEAYEAETSLLSLKLHSLETEQGLSDVTIPISSDGVIGQKKFGEYAIADSTSYTLRIPWLVENDVHVFEYYFNSKLTNNAFNADKIKISLIEGELEKATVERGNTTTPNSQSEESVSLSATPTIAFNSDNIVISGCEENVYNAIKDSTSNYCNLELMWNTEHGSRKDNLGINLVYDEHGKVVKPEYDATNKTLTIDSDCLQYYGGNSGTASLKFNVGNTMYIDFGEGNYTIPRYNYIPSAGSTSGPDSQESITVSFNSDSNYVFKPYTDSDHKKYIEFRMRFMKNQDEKFQYYYRKEFTGDQESTKSVSFTLSEISSILAGTYDVVIDYGNHRFGFGNITVPDLGNTQAKITSSDNRNYSITSLPNNFEDTEEKILSLTRTVSSGTDEHTETFWFHIDKEKSIYDSSAHKLNFDFVDGVWIEDGESPDGDYVVTLITSNNQGERVVYLLNTEQTGTRAAIHFPSKRGGSGGSDYGVVGKVWMRSNDPQDTIYIFGINDGFSGSLFSSQGHKLSWTRSDDHPFEFYAGIVEYHGQPISGFSHLYKMNVNNISQHGYEGEYKNRVVLESSNGGSLYTFLICDGPTDTTELGTDKKKLTLKSQVVDHSGAACKLTSDSDIDDFKLVLDCRESTDGTWNASADQVTDWLANQTYTITLNKPQSNPQGINLTSGTINGDGTITFTADNFDYNSIYRIEAGTYYANFTARYSNNGDEKLFLRCPLYDIDGTNNITFTKDTLKESPKLIIKEEPDKSGITISCDSNFPQAACETYLSELTRQEKSTGIERSEMRFYRNGDQRTTGKPFVALSEYGDDATKNIKNNGSNIFIPARAINGIGVATGSLASGDKYRIEVQVFGYEKNEIPYSFSNIGVTDINDLQIKMDDQTRESGWSVFYIEGDNYIEDYFESVKRVTFNVDTGWTIALDENNSKVQKNNSTNRNELFIKSEAIYARPKNNAAVNFFSNKYSRMDFNVDIHNCTLTSPNDLAFKVETSGIRAYSNDKEYLKKVLDLRFSYKKADRQTDKTNATEINGHKQGSYDDVTGTFFMPLTKNDLEKITDKAGNNNYITDATATGYVDTWNRNAYCLNPISFAGDVTSASEKWENETVTSGEELKEMDSLAKILQNGYVVTAGEIRMEDAVKDMGVDLSGAVAGAISTDNQSSNPDFDEIDTAAKQDGSTKVTVERNIQQMSADVDDMIKAVGLDSAEKTDVMFDVLIKKNNAEIIQLPFGAELRFKMPEGYSGTYVLLSKHKDHENKVSYKKIKVTVIDGYGYAHTDQFSSFALVKDTNAKPTPAPSKKESSSGSSAPKKDNVVTCQMAGYPANYAWNESVKACQPGYLDNNGVFHLTTGNTNKRVGVVNTSDKGVGGTIAALISSTIAAIAAAYALKKWN